MIAHRSATSNIAQYLDGLLRPIVQRSIYSTRFANGADFMRKFHQYGYMERRLRPHTLFVSMKILHFDTITTHMNMLSTLEGFLQDALIGPNMDKITIRKFLDLTGIFLKNNRFYYEGTIYRFVRGGPNQLPFVQTLSNMFTYTWEKVLIRELSLTTEFFGR